ncbi:MAG: choice-of-anchor J domain-containing protein, partial [Bacteroidota bacterium]|nr:choice-of-anchor J domain-containing protein [Bacteroidota bacterium]
MRKIYLLLFTVCMFAGRINAQVDGTAPGRRLNNPGVTTALRIDMRSRPFRNNPVHPDFNNNTRINSPCPGPTNVPYFENFDGVTAPSVPDCITVENVNGGNTWRTVDFDFPYPSSSPNIMRLDFEPDGITPADDWFFTQGLNLTAGTSYRLTFEYRNSDGTRYIEKLEVKYGSAANAASMTSGTLFSNTNINFNLWQEGGTDFTPSVTGVYYIGFHGFSDANQAYLAVDNVKVDATPVCPPPIGVTISNITSSSATVNFTPTGSNFVIEYGLTGFIPGTGASPGIGGTVISINSTQLPYTINGLTSLDTFDVYVRQVCSGSSYGPNSTVATFSTPLVNDDAPGAITITVDAPCSGNGYTNFGATQSPAEPFASCTGTAGYNTVWYKFVAPAGGAVKVSNDFAGAGLGDSRMAVFSATNVNDYNTFTILGCDDDNGVGSSTKSIIYLAGLTPGNTYYIQVDGNNPSATQGSFCLEVSTLTSTMIAGTASCGSSQGFANLNTTYTGWISLVDNSGNLIANVKQTTGTATSVSANITVNTAAVRTDVTSGQKYLDRNFFISAAGATNATIQFFFLNSELATLQTADPSVTLANLGATRQTGSVCQADFLTANGTNSYLKQASNGSVNGVSWIQVSTPGLSNFYLHTSKAPVTLKTFLQGAYNAGLGRHKDVIAGWATILNTSALNQPYNVAPFNYSGTESVAPGFFTSSTGSTTDILDWVLLELRSSAPPAAPIATRAAFIREDGAIVDLDGVSSVSFRGIANGSYYITIRHRNHLGIRTATVQLVDGALGSNPSPPVYDFSAALTQAFKDVTITTNEAMAQNGSVFMMWAGNANTDNFVRVTSQILPPISSDAAFMLGTILGGNPNGTFSGYSVGDINMDGKVRVTSQILPPIASDAAFILSTPLGGNPNGT